MVFLACVHLALFLALFFSPISSLVSSWYDHSMLASLLWQCLTVPSLLQLCWERTHLFSLFMCSVNLPLHHKVQKFSSGTSLPGWSRKKGRKMVVVVVLNVGHIKPGGVMVRSLDLWLIGSRFNSWPCCFQVTTLGKLFTVFTHVPLSPSSINWYWSKGMMLYGWEGNRRSGVVLAMRHRLQWFIHSGLSTCGLNGLQKTDEHPSWTPLRSVI